MATVGHEREDRCSGARHAGEVGHQGNRRVRASRVGNETLAGHLDDEHGLRPELMVLTRRPGPRRCGAGVADASWRQ